MWFSSEQQEQKNMTLWKYLTFGLLLCIHSSSQDIDYDGFPNICLENTQRDKSRQQHRCRHQCGYFSPIISKTITCENIMTSDLELYQETKDELASEEDLNYPLTLKVINSNIPLLKPSTFKNLKKLTTLTMENDKLETIIPAAFNYLDQLKELSLGTNELTTISDGLFNTLTALEKLDLSRNRIETISKHAFAGINLRHLNLNHNNISDLDEMLVGSFHILSSLDMSYNRLKNISTFHFLHLNTLNLSHNNLEAVDFEIFATLDGYLDVSFNNITDIKNYNLSKASSVILSHNKLKILDQNAYVEFLDVSYNYLESISGDALNTGMKEVHFSFNRLSGFDSDTFFGMTELTHLYLDGNQISSIPTSAFKDLTSLEFLNMSGNQLDHFNFGTFDNLKSLTTLDISHNKFKELPQFTLHSLERLRVLSLENNQLSNVNIDELLKHLPLLQEVNLNGNAFSCQGLVDIVHKLKTKNIFFPVGENIEESNVHGMKCLDSVGKANVLMLNGTLDEDFTKTILYNYFNEGFRDSQFYKYLESLNATKNIDYAALKTLLDDFKSQNSNSNKTDLDLGFQNSQLYQYFNKDFKNSTFFKYMESFKSENNSARFEKTMNSFEKRLEKFLDSNKPNQTFENTGMFEYFNKGFRSSNFFRYLEGLSRATKITENTVEGVTEKLVNPFEKSLDYPNYTGLLSTIAIILSIIMFVVVVTAYRLVLKKTKYNSAKKEEVELI